PLRGNDRVHRARLGPSGPGRAGEPGGPRGRDRDRGGAAGAGTTVVGTPAEDPCLDARHRPRGVGAVAARQVRRSARLSRGRSSVRLAEPTGSGGRHKPTGSINKEQVWVTPTTRTVSSRATGSNSPGTASSLPPSRDTASRPPSPATASPRRSPGTVSSLPPSRDTASRPPSPATASPRHSPATVRRPAPR